MLTAARPRGNGTEAESDFRQVGAALSPLSSLRRGRTLARRPIVTEARPARLQPAGRAAVHPPRRWSYTQRLPAAAVRLR